MALPKSRYLEYKTQGASTLTCNARKRGQFMFWKNSSGSASIAQSIFNCMQLLPLKLKDFIGFCLSSTDCIMFPEVPIALRLSGHLLYGLVRIYSLKVKYLVQDCNRMVDDIRTVFTSVQVNLPVDADRAPFESVTLPNIFDLDAVELDDHMEVPDNHLKTYDQITIQDLIPMEGEQYVSIFINEDNRVDSSPHHDISKSNHGSGPMEENTLPPSEGEVDDQATTNENGAGGRYSAPIYRKEDDVLPPFPFEDEVDDHATPTTTVPIDTNVRSLNEGNFSNEPPEVLRDAVRGAEQERVDAINDIVGVHEQSVPSMSKNGSLSPIIEGLSVSGEASLPSPTHNKVPTAASADDLDIPNTEISLGQHLADVELQPSPPVNQNVRRKRKKRQFFDETIVLRNTEMKRQVEDPPSKLVCKRRKLPCSALDVWRSTRIRRNERFFHEPLICGMSTKLQEFFERKTPSRSESTSVEVPDMEIEPERPRFGVHDDEISHDLIQSSPVREVFTCSTVPNLGSASDKGKGLEHEELPTFGNPASAEPVGPELTTPSVNLEEQLHLDDSNLGEFPTLQKSADVEELTFLEASNASSGGYDANEVGTMSMMTRKVAQYLNELSPMAHTPEEQSGCISLNKILERKPRKQCARMFFETLVLKSCGFVDVQQEEPYGDILISRTPALSSMKF